MKKEYLIPKMGIDNFGWSEWRAGAHIWLALGFHARTISIVENADILRKYAIGYIPGNRLSCRPEENEVAVMFSINGIDGWTHLRKHEFERVFSC